MPKETVSVGHIVHTSFYTLSLKQQMATDTLNQAVSVDAVFFDCYCSQNATTATVTNWVTHLQWSYLVLWILVYCIYL